MTQQENTVPCHHPVDFNDKAIQKKFDQWMANSKQTQVRAVSALTGLLYIVAFIADSLVAPKELLPLMTIVHFYIMPPYLFLISLLTFKKELSKLTLVLLFLSPIVAAVGNLVIVSQIADPSMRLTEIYLSLFWIFTVSGLRLKQAILSAVTVSVLVFVVTYFYFSMTTENFVMHCFWMIASFSFGFLGAYLLERSSKAVFVNQEQLKQLAVTDRLTGLFNRIKLDEVLQEELTRSQRYQGQFGLVIIDFDYFKNINDTYGHQVGDEALIEIAKLITEHLRSSDKAIRWGGEEFIIIYLDTDRKEVLMLAEDLRQKIEQHTFRTVGTRTASFGVTLSTNGDTINSIIQRADKALYSAKNSGRNCIVFQ